MAPCSTIEPAVASLSGFHGEDVHIITAIAGKVSCHLRSEVRRKKETVFCFFFSGGETVFLKGVIPVDVPKPKNM